MTKMQKIGLILLIIGTLAYVKFAFFPSAMLPVQEEQVTVEETTQEAEQPQEDVPKASVNLYFIGQNDKKEEVYKVIKREYNSKTDGTKIKFAISELLKGPSKSEKAKGVYSEIPSGTKLIAIEETPEKITVNLSGDFEQGGGTDGLYKRLYQLIKTANKNTALDVYLLLNGKPVEVIGGEGIMINQPLNSSSLGE